MISTHAKPTLLSPFPIPTNQNIKQSTLSPSGKIELRVVKGEKDGLYLEIWRSVTLIRRKKIDPQIKEVVNDDFFGRPAFSSSEKKIEFIGERVEQKFKTFWSEEEDGKSKDEEGKGKEEEGKESKDVEKEAKKKKELEI